MFASLQHVMPGVDGTREGVLDSGPMIRWLAWLALVALGCSNDLAALLTPSDAGANDARVRDTAEAAADAAPAPGFSHLEEGACRTCLQRQCGDEEAACFEDSVCRAEAVCQASCTDPACFNRCWTPGSATPLDFWACRLSCYSDCARRDLACLGEFDWDVGESRLLLRVVENFTFAPLEGVAVRVCDPLAAACEASWSSTDAAGEVELDLNWYFRPYLEVEAPGYDPVLFYPNAFAAGRNPRAQLTLTPPSDYAAAFMLNGLTDDPAFGCLHVLAVDCLGFFASGVSWVSPDPSAVPFYGYPPDTEKTETGSDGFGGFVFVPPGFVDLVAVQAGTEDVFGRARVLTRPGTRTWVFLGPLAAGED